ncbi:MAG: HAMP domain-containing sensor histidine kinase [Pseudomonadota bacterium]
MQAPDLPALTAWHAGWAVAAALLALAARWLGGVDGPVFFAALGMAVPGLAGLTLLWRDGPNARIVVMLLWGLAALVSGALSGGLAGALPGLLALPFAAGLAFGAPRLAVAGAMGSTVAALGGVVTAWLSVSIDPPPLLAGASIILAAGATALALRGAWRGNAARVDSAEASVHRVEAILAAQPGLTLMLEPSGRVLAAYGTPPPSLPVDPLFEAGLIAAVHAPDRPAILSAIERALAGADAQTRFAPRVALDRRVILIVRRVEDPHGPRLIAQAFDGTAQYAREVGMETQRAEAEAQSMGKSRFLANMSHELRTPLNAVIGFADIMRQRLFGPLPDRYGEYADSIHEAGGHLLELINDVLDVSKIEADRYQLSIERFDAREVVSAAMALVRVTAEDKGVELHGVLPADAVDVAADRRALKQITLNLLSNAVKFTPSGGSVTVTLETIGPYLEVVVSDTGVGIAPEDLKRLGRPFEQAGGVEQRAQGTGLGLSLVRALAELHNGRMSMDSTLGEGSAVTVRLPVIAVSRPAPPEGGAEIIPLRAEG